MTAEDHDYEPGYESPHRMETDPPCRICGGGKRGHR